MYMFLSVYTFGEGTVFLGCLFIHSFIRPDRSYNDVSWTALSILGEPYVEYSLAATDGRIRF